MINEIYRSEKVLAAIFYSSIFITFVVFYILYAFFIIPFNFFFRILSIFYRILQYVVMNFR